MIGGCSIARPGPRNNYIGSKTVVNSASNLRISGDDNNNIFFHGLIDEVQIYNRALFASEIQAIFTAGNVGNRPAPPSGLVSSWPADGDATDTAGAQGLPTKITRPNGAVTTMSYDSLGNLLTSTDPVNGTTAFTASGRLAAMRNDTSSHVGIARTMILMRRRGRIAAMFGQL